MKTDSAFKNGQIAFLMDMCRTLANGIADDRQALSSDPTNLEIKERVEFSEWALMETFRTAQEIKNS